MGAQIIEKLDAAAESFHLLVDGPGAIGFGSNLGDLGLKRLEVFAVFVVRESGQRTSETQDEDSEGNRRSPAQT